MIQLSVTIIALSFFIEILDKELLKYEIKNSNMIDKDEKAITFLSLKEKGLVSLLVVFKVKVWLHRG